MLFKLNKFLNLSRFTSYPKSAFSTQTQSSASPILLDTQILYPFSKHQTSIALNCIQDTVHPQLVTDPSQLIHLDKLSATSYSETTRVFHKQHKIFLAEKIINVDSTNAWNQVNLILRQLCAGKFSLAKIVSIDYNQNTKQLKMYSEIDKTLLGDYSQYRTRSSIKWSNDILSVFTWQLLHQLNTMRLLGAECDQLILENMFIEKATSRIKLYDLSGFHVESDKNKPEISLIGTMPANLNKVIYTLVKLVSPFAPVNDSKEARDYLKEKYPEFMKDLRDIEDKVRKSSAWWNSNQEQKIKEEMRMNMATRPIFIDKQFNQFLAHKLIQTLQSQNQKDFPEKWNILKDVLDAKNEAQNVNENVYISQCDFEPHEPVMKNKKKSIFDKNNIKLWIKVLLIAGVISCILGLSELYYVKEIFGKTKNDEEIDEDAAFILDIFNDLNEIKGKIIHALTFKESNEN